MTYLKSIENFRAIAIIVIVAGHALNFSNFPNSLFFQNFFYNFFTGGTFYFVFISGVLFHHVFYINFNYKNFIKGKIKNVFLPYLILSIIFLTYIIFTYQDNIFNTEQNSLFFESAFFIIKKLLLGDHVMGYWYIPFIMSIFIFSHIFIRYIKLNNVNKFMILFVLLINSILMMRPNTSSFLSLIQSVLYFFPVYIIGILYSENRHKINSLIFKKEKILLFFSIFFFNFSHLSW
ncbi:MAG: hypothetical protein CMC86_07650 [Flavobacteriaceae bacterium]|nr:hypothetical protein [Flavobacteriaceae bacterium]